MDSRSTATPSRSTILSTSIRDKIVDFDNLRENVNGKLSLENWMVLPSHRSLHIFSLNQKSNGNLSVRNTIFIDIDLVVKVFGENNDDMLFSLKLYSWLQLQTLIEQCGAQVKREVDLEFVDVVGKAANSVTNSGQQKDTLAIECRGINTKAETEVFDFHQPLTELIESSIAESEALGYKNTFISQSSFFPEAPLIYSEDGYQNAGLMSYKANERYMRQSQICSICNESYVIGEMDRHMQQHFNRESYPCHVCGGEFRSLSGIQKHMKSKHFTVRDEFFCDICESEICFETEASIEEHMKNKHCTESIKEQGFNCSTCNKDFVTLKQFKAHMRRHDKSMWKPCPICNKSYSSLSRHMNDKHLNIRNHVCEICGSAYKQWVSLKEHIETHHMPHEEFFCDICNNGKDYRSKAHLKKHFAKVHAKVSQRRRNLCKPFYECEFCNEKLSSRYTLKTHLATRHNVVGDDSNFPCNVCDKTFTLKSSLVVHAKLHTGKLHICRECGQSFNHPNYLRKHLNRHKDIKKRKCTLCEKEYVQNVDLRLHMKKVHGVIVPVRNINIKKM